MAISEIPAYTTAAFSAKERAYCVIVGVLNEGEKFTRQLAAMQAFRKDADIIVADGGSTDGATSEEALKDKVTALLVKTGPGGLSAQYRMALKFALDQGYRGIVSVDGNGKDGVEAIPRFIEALQNGADLVQGSRFLPGGEHKNTPLIRSLGIRFIFNPLMWAGCNFWYTDGMNGFKAFSPRLLRDMRVQPFRKEFDRYSLQYYLCYRASRLGFKVVEIPVARNYPDSGEVPTKIHGVKSYLRILLELAGVLLGLYNP